MIVGCLALNASFEPLTMVPLRRALRLVIDGKAEVVEQVMPREMLYIADELFFTGTAAEITPIRSVDRIQVGNGRRGPITTAIQEAYMGIAEGRLPDKYGWRTAVPVPAAKV